MYKILIKYTYLREEEKVPEGNLREPDSTVIMLENF